MNLHLILASLTATLSLGIAAQAAPAKVACVGDSITFGTGLKPGETRYPQVLATLMGRTLTSEASAIPEKRQATTRARQDAGTAAPGNTSKPWNSRRIFISATLASTTRAAGGTPNCSPKAMTLCFMRGKTPIPKHGSLPGGCWGRTTAARSTRRHFPATAIRTYVNMQARTTAHPPTARKRKN